MNTDLAAATEEELLGLAEAVRQARYRVDPVAWVQERLGEDCWSKQAQIAASVRDHRRTAVHACHDSGKSWIAARLACWWIDSHPPGEAVVVTSAPTAAQVRSILWKEMRAAHKRGGLAGAMNQTEWLIEGDQVAMGRKPADYDQAAFQGIHAKYELVILDEASGIPEMLWTAAATMTTSEHSRLLAIGNPDDPASHFAKVCAPNSGWSVIKISAFDTPNFTKESVSGVDPLSWTRVSLRRG